MISNETLNEVKQRLVDRFHPDKIILLTPKEYERDRQIPGTIARRASLEGRVLYENAG